MADTTRGAARPLTRRRFLQGSALAGVARSSPRAARRARPRRRRRAAPRPPPRPAPPPGRPPPRPPRRRPPPRAPSPTSADAQLRELDRLHRRRRQDDAKHPTLEKFTEGVRDDRQLRRGDRRQRGVLRHDPAPARAPAWRPSWDLIVVTDWMVARLVRLGWLEQIDAVRHAELPGQPPRSYLKAARSTPTRTFARAVAVGDDRARLRRQEDRRPESLDVLFDATVQGQGRRT